MGGGAKMTESEFRARVLEVVPGLRAFVRLNMPADLLARESCSDLAQSICRELFTEQPEFEWRGPQAFGAWVFRYAAGKVRDRIKYHRREKRSSKRESATDPDEVRGLYQSIGTPSAHAIAAEQTDLIERAFANLRAEDREVISLCSVLGMPREEVAEILGKDAGAVRTHLHRAKVRLAVELDRLGISI